MVRPDDDPVFLGLTNGDFVSGEKASVNASAPATDCAQQSI